MGVVENFCAIILRNIRTWPYQPSNASYTYDAYYVDTEEKTRALKSTYFRAVATSQVLRYLPA